MKDCRLATWLTYAKNLSGWNNSYAKLGIVVHNVLERYGIYCNKYKLATDYEEFDRIVNSEILNLPESQYADAKRILENVKNTKTWDHLFDYPVVNIERRFKLDKDFNPVPDSEENPYFSGGIDLMYNSSDNIGFVRDYKTVRAIYTKTEMKNSLQRKYYSLLVMKHYPELTEVIFNFDFSRYGYISDDLTITRDDLPAIEAQLKSECEDYYNLMNEKNPPDANPGGHCLLCGNRGNCPKYKNAFSLDERIESDKDATRLLGEYKLAQIKLKQVETILKSRVEHFGPISNGRDEYGPVAENSTSIPDPKKLIDTLISFEIPEGAIYEAVSISATEYKKLVRKFKMTEIQKKELEKLVILGKKTKFKSYKKEEDEELTSELSGETFDPYL